MNGTPDDIAIDKSASERVRAATVTKREYRQMASAIRHDSPWYKKSGDIIGLVAILITILLAIWAKYERKELSFFYSFPAAIIPPSEGIKAKTTFTLNNEPINELWRVTIYVKNIGTNYISKEDFKDGPLTIKVFCTNELHRNPPNPLPLLLDVAVKNNAGQRQDKLEIVNRHSPAELNYLPSLLNPEDFVELELYLSTTQELRILPHAKLANGKIRNLGSRENLVLHLLHLGLS